MNGTLRFGTKEVTLSAIGRASNMQAFVEGPVENRVAWLRLDLAARYMMSMLRYGEG